MEQYRQGDVLVVRVEALPFGAQPVKEDAGRVVLAYGEVTGHAHAFSPEQVKTGRVKMWSVADQAYITVEEPGATLTHEEHGPHTFAPGTYQVVRQREYTPEEIRNVAD